MPTDNLTKVKKLEKQLIAAIILLFVLIIGFLAIYDLKPGQEALAITGNYSKISGAELTVGDWNNLQADFVDASGDTMTSALTVEGSSGQTGLVMKLTSTTDSNSPLIKFDSTSAGVSNIWWMRQEGNMWALKTSPSNFTSAITAIRANDIGNVGIGTASSPTEKLQVEGNIKLGGLEGNVKDVDAIIGYNDLFLKSNSAENAPVYMSGSQLNFYTGGSEKMRITSAGSVGIGVTNPNPQAKLDVAGDIAVNGRSYIKIGSVNHGAGDSFEESGKDILDLKSIVGNLENAKKCLVFVVASKPEHGYDYKPFCREDSNGFIDAALVQDTIGSYDGEVTCGYICTATADQNVVYY